MDSIFREVVKMRSQREVPINMRDKAVRVNIPQLPKNMAPTERPDKANAVKDYCLRKQG